MKFLSSTNLCLLLITLFFGSFVKAQCPVTAYASRQTINCGDSVVLTAVAQGCNPLLNNFNDGTLGSWFATPGAVITNGTNLPAPEFSCVGAPPEGPFCLWMGDNIQAPRYVETNSYDLTTCSGGATLSASICFNMKYGLQGATTPCEGIDLVEEGIALQYSINNGTTWTTINFWDPNGGYDPNMTTWQYYCLNIPAAAITANTKFRWYQNASSTDPIQGNRFDTWGLDDMRITLNGNAYTYDWAHDNLSPAPNSFTPAVRPTSTTTYTVTYTNGTAVCNSSVTVVVNNNASVTASANKLLVCEGSPVQLQANSTIIPLPPTTCASAPVVCDPNTTVAIEKQVGNGAVLSQTGNSGIGYLGANNFNGAVRSQFILRASDLIAAGLQAGKFTNMQFDVASNDVGTKTFNQFEVTFVCTSLNALPSNYVNHTNGVIVHNAQNISVATGWTTINFNNAFQWDGTTNILINICWKSNQSGTIRTRHYNVGYAATKTDGTNTAGTNSWDCLDNTDPFTTNYNSLPNFKFGQCIPRPGVLNYTWTSIPAGFTSNVYNPTANPPTNPTKYVVSVLEQGYPAGCAVSDTITISTYKPTVTVNPNPANICPPGTTSANLVSTASTNSGFTAPRTFTNNTAAPIAEAGGLPGLCGTAGAATSSVIAVSGASPLTLAANPIIEVAINMTCTRVTDYRVELLGPSGQTINLLNQTGAGANLTNTRFRTGAPAFTTGTAPYNGVYSPVTAFNGITGNVNGNWTLRITDLCRPVSGTSTGSLVSWSITFNTPNYVQTYAWSPATGLSSTTTPNTTASPSSNQTYTLTVTDAVGCSNSVQVPVNVSSAPSIPVNSASICAGGSATLTAVPFDGGGGTYSWSPGGQTTPSITVTPASTTGYTVTYASGGCTGTGSGTVTVNPTPTLSFTPRTICLGQSTTLTATPSQTGGTYAWSNGGTTQTISVSPTTTQYYKVTYSLNGCSKLDSVLVTVNNAGSVSVNSNTVCAGNPATLTATPTIGGGTYSWAPGGQTTPSITPSPSSTTTYTVTYSLNGCTATGTGTITVNPNPSVSVNSTTICNGGSATLTATVAPSGGTYLWSPGGSTNPSITVSPASTTTYSVQYTVNGCQSNASGTVTVGASATLTATDTTICNGGTATLNAIPSVTGGSYLWAPGNQTTPSITVSPTATSNYTVNYTLNGCQYSDVSTVTVVAAPTVNLRDTSLCAGGSVVLTPTVTPSGGTYSWSTGATTPTITVSPAATTNYTVTYSIGSCSASNSNVVTVAPALSATISGGGAICSSQTTTVNVNFVGAGPYNIVYNDGTNNVNVAGIATSPYVITTGAAGTYTLVSVSNATCTGTVSGSAVVSVTPSIVISNTNGVCDGMGNYSISFQINGGDPNSYNVTGMNGGTISASAPYIFTSNPIPTGTSAYSFNVSDASGCPSATVSGSQNCGCVASATMSGGGTACSGNSVNITLNMTGTGPWDVDYSDGTNIINLTGISSPYVISTSTPGTYSLVSVLDATSCNGSVSGSATVTIQNNPTVTVNSPTICQGASVNLTATPSQSGGTYLWSNGATGQSISVSPGTGSNPYSVSYTLNGCSGSGNGTVTVNPTPTVSSNDTTICSGSTAVLYAAGSPSGGTYTWNPVGTNGSTINVSPTNTSNFQVVYTLNSCSGNDVSTVTVNPSPSVSVNSPTICEGSNAVITATPNISGGTYLWSPGGQTTPSITLNSPAAGTSNYSVTYTLNNCSATASSTVTVTQTPTLSIVNDTICTGETATLVSNTNVPGGNYTWGPGTNPNSPNLVVSPTTTTNYTLNYNVNGCTNSAAGKVVVNPAPSISVNNSTICGGETTTLTATTSNPGGVYSWSPGSFGNTASISVSPSATTTYTVSYDLNGCTVTANGTVTVNNSATVVVQDSTICQGGNATLTAVPSVGGGTYMWSSGQTTPTITVSPNSSTNYTVTYTLNGCTSSDPATVTVNPVPTVDVTDNVNICEGNSAVLTANPSLPNGTYSWVTPPANNQTTQSITVSPTTTTKYYVNYVLNGCAAIDSGTVNVTPAPTISVSNDAICQGEVGVLNATTNGNPASITWSPGGFTGPTISVSPATTTTYTATISFNNCTNTATGTVTVTPIPTTTATNSGPYCQGDSIQLNASNVNGATYQWAGPNGYSSGTRNSGRPNSTMADTGEYQVIISLNGCSSSSFTRVVITPPTQSTIAQVGPYCQDATPVNLTSNNPGGTWSGTGITNANMGTFNPTNANVGNNVITYTPAAGACQTTATSTIVVNALPVVDFTASSLFGCVPFNTSFTDNSNPSSASVSWNFGNSSTSTQLGTVSTSYPLSGLYDITLTSTSSAGCVATLTKPQYVEALDNAVADFDFNPKKISNSNPTVNMSNLSSNADSYIWTFGNLGTSTQENPSFNFGQAVGNQVITLIATNAGGCADTIFKVVEITEDLLYYIPNTFTPDGDKFNQTFQPVFTSGYDPNDYVMQIFNRWGELLFETKDVNIGWDGTYKNLPAPQGAYIWLVRFKVTQSDEKIVDQGTVNIIR